MDLDDFKRFVRRGLETEGVDEREIVRLYRCCLQSGKPGSGRVAIVDALDVDQLARALAEGRWRKLWDKYAADARRRALDKGCVGASFAVYGITSKDPLSAPNFPSMITSMSWPFSWLALVLQVAFLPLLAPLSSKLPSTARAMFLTRFALPPNLRAYRGPFSDSLAVVLYVAPLWCVGFVCVAVYAAYRPEYLMGDCLYPALLSTMLVRAIHWFPYDRVRVVNADP